MNRGKVFLSSTIYDFQDLRSALKYWLSEMGYEVYTSEINDFPRDSAENSYQTCLSAIEKCDWYILLIGNRYGGKFRDPDTDQTISITQQFIQFISREALKQIYRFKKRNKIIQNIAPFFKGVPQ